MVIAAQEGILVEIIARMTPKVVLMGGKSDDGDSTMTHHEFKQAAPHVYWLSPDGATDRPVLGVVAGKERARSSSMPAFARCTPACCSTTWRRRGCLRRAFWRRPTGIGITGSARRPSTRQPSPTSGRRILVEQAAWDWSDAARCASGAGHRDRLLPRHAQGRTARAQRPRPTARLMSPLPASDGRPGRDYVPAHPRGRRPRSRLGHRPRAGSGRRLFSDCRYDDLHHGRGG